MDGISFVPVIMGIFGLGEILTNAEVRMKPITEAKMNTLIPTLRDFKDSFWPIMRGQRQASSRTHSWNDQLGLLFLAYIAEKKTFEASGEVRDRKLSRE